MNTNETFKYVRNKIRSSKYIDVIKISLDAMRKSDHQEVTEYIKTVPPWFISYFIKLVLLYAEENSNIKPRDYNFFLDCIDKLQDISSNTDKDLYKSPSASKFFMD